MNRYPHFYRILNLVLCAAGKTILLAKKGMKEITRVNQPEPELLESRNIRNKSIPFVHDCITSGTTARLCYEVLAALGDHMDGLIWVYAGG